MTRIRPCIDLRGGKVVQIVGGSLRDDGAGLRTNHESPFDAASFARLYRSQGMEGGHVIMLGPGSEEAARSALAAWPGGLQVGGGITAATAPAWLAAGARQVIVTSWLFVDGHLDLGRAEALAATLGRGQVVIDLSCRRVEGGWRVATDRWQTVTSTPVDGAILERLATCCSEFLVHAADVEGLCRGMDRDLVRHLGALSPLPCTYAGGISSLDEILELERLSGGRLDCTVGSALDIFGGRGVAWADCVAWNRTRVPSSLPHHLEESPP